MQVRHDGLAEVLEPVGPRHHLLHVFGWRACWRAPEPRFHVVGQVGFVGKPVLVPGVVSEVRKHVVGGRHAFLRKGNARAVKNSPPPQHTTRQGQGQG